MPNEDNTIVLQGTLDGTTLVLDSDSTAAIEGETLVLKEKEAD